MITREPKRRTRKVRVNVMLSPETITALDCAAGRRCISRSQLLEHCFNYWASVNNVNIIGSDGIGGWK